MIIQIKSNILNICFAQKKRKENWSPKAGVWSLAQFACVPRKKGRRVGFAPDAHYLICQNTKHMIEQEKREILFLEIQLV